MKSLYSGRALTFRVSVCSLMDDVFNFSSSSGSEKKTPLPLLISHKSGFAPRWFCFPVSKDYATNFGVASDQVTSILGTAQVGNDPDNLGGQNVTPYYQIELTSNFGFNKISNGIPS